MPALTPYPLGVLLGRVAEEWETRHRIFDMPSGRFFHPEPTHDLCSEVGGLQVATPVGPAAGPHTQLAQNYVLGWLAGARAFEMKTVQILDELQIERPCIDMETIGFNTEWSQELTIDQSIEEYAKAWMMLAILARWSPLQPHIYDPGPHVFDLSVGYDLAGISSPRMHHYIETMCDASAVIDELRAQIPEPFGALRDHPFPSRIVSTATLSTFHGCPPTEIEAIARYLMAEHDLDVVVKLNPTLLGYDTTERLLSGVLGYDGVRLDPAAFEADLQFERGVELIDSMARHAEEHGRRFGIKLTNTLVVHNDRGLLPGPQTYLSGQPLHVLAISLLERLHHALPGLLALGPGPGPVAVSFSAGIDHENFPAAVGLGLSPVTVCSNLLKPGGYGHLSSMLKKLGRAMQDAACNTIDQWIGHRHDLAVDEGHDSSVEAYAAEVRGPEGVARYGRSATAKGPRQLDRVLELWDCVSCNLCVTVCPNDAMVHLATADGSGLEEKWQYFCLAELCNDCGNCTTFCPEEGAPFAVKPRLFIDADRFAGDRGPAVLVSAGNGRLNLTPSATMAGEIELLDSLLNGPHGLPLRSADLAG